MGIDFNLSSHPLPSVEEDRVSGPISFLIEATIDSAASKNPDAAVPRNSIEKNIPQIRDGGEPRADHMITTRAISPA